MMESIGKEAIWKIDQFSHRNLARVLECCARLDFFVEPLFNWVGRWLPKQVLSEWNGTDLCTVLCAFASISKHHSAIRRGSEELARVVGEELGRQAPDMDE